MYILINELKVYSLSNPTSSSVNLAYIWKLIHEVRFKADWTVYVVCHSSPASYRPLSKHETMIDDDGPIVAVLLTVMTLNIKTFQALSERSLYSIFSAHAWLWCAAVWVRCRRDRRRMTFLLHPVSLEKIGSTFLPAKWLHFITQISEFHFYQIHRFGVYQEKWYDMNFTPLPAICFGEGGCWNDLSRDNKSATFGTKQCVICLSSCSKKS